MSYFILNDETARTEYQFGNYKTDGTLAYIQKNASDEIEQIIMQDTKKLYVGSDLIVDSAKEFKEMAIRWNGNVLEISSTPINSLTDTPNSVVGARGVDLSCVSIFAGKADTVTVNGETVEFELLDGRFIFPNYEVPVPPIPEQEFKLTRAGSLTAYNFEDVTDSLELEFDVTPNVTSTNIVFAATSSDKDTSTANPYGSFAAILRMNPSGSVWDAYDSTTYRAANSLTYEKGKTYHVTMRIDVKSQKYSAWVAVDGNEVQIADNYRFRASGIDRINQVFACLESMTGTLNDVELSNFNIILSDGT